MTRQGRTLQVGVLSLSILLVVGCASRPRARSSPGTDTGAAAPIQWDHAGFRGGVFYEVFVRSFCDSDGDGVGDLPGLTSKLDYLNDGNPATNSDLGVEGIWLMPIFRSPSYHGYDTADYTRINPDYGTEEDFTRFLDEAHRRGIRVIVDLVMNHCSAQHPWFVDAASPSSSKRNWFVWRRDDPGWTQPWGGNNPTWHESGGSYYYGVFWGGMPDLNFRNPQVRRQMEDYAALWLGRGVDGFRLDATRHLIEDGPGQQQVDTPETHEFLKEFSASVRNVNPQAILVGENWTDTAIIADYFGSTAQITGGDELPISFDFPLAGAIVDGVGSDLGEGIAIKLEEIKRTYPPGVNDAPFLTNHDMVRLATQLRDDPVKLRLAASILLTLPGTPFLYYGEEVGLRNGTTSNDEAKRTPMPWDGTPGGGFTAGEAWFSFAPGREKANVSSETADPLSLLSHYRRLVRLRARGSALRDGTIEILATGPQSSPALAFERANGQERLLVVCNLGENAMTVGPLALRATSTEKVFADGEAGEPAAVEAGWVVPMPPSSIGVWRLQ